MTEVVCAVILAEGGLLYAFRRPASGDNAGRWEFPGGRVEAGETPEDALHRELSEELSLAITIDRALPDVADERIRLRPFVCRILPGSAFRLRVHDAVRLDTPDALLALDWCPLDRLILEDLPRDDG